MKILNTLVTYLLFALLLSSCCTDINLVDLIPDPDTDYCNSINPDSDFDTFIWESNFNDDLKPISIQASPIIYQDQIILPTSSKEDLVFKVFDKSSGEFIQEHLIDIRQGHIDDIRYKSHLILVKTGNTLSAISISDFSIEWEIEFNGYGIDNNRYIITDNGELLIPSSHKHNNAISVFLNVFDLQNGSAISTKLIQTPYLSQSSFINFSSLKYDEDSETFFMAYTGFLESDNKVLEILSYNLSENSISWKWNTVAEHIRPVVMEVTDAYVSVVANSMFFLNYYTGIEEFTKTIEYPNHSTLGTPIIRSIDNQMVLIRINSVSVSAISLLDFATVWETQNYDLLTPEDVVIDEAITVNTKDGLRKIDIRQGLESIQDEMPYNCSHMDEHFAWDHETKVIYFTDSKRLYALGMDEN